MGLPNPVLGEISCAFIKLKGNCHESEENIKNYLANKVVKYKIPDRILFLDQFPLNHNGKIQKNILKEMALEQDISASKQLV